MLNKQELWDFVNIRHGWPLSQKLRSCVCRSSFNFEHALTCKKGGCIKLHHKRMGNIITILLKEMCQDVCIELTLQKLTGEQFEKPTANTSRKARRSSKVILGSRSNIIFKHKSFLLKRYLIC